MSRSCIFEDSTFDDSIRNVEGQKCERILFADHVEKKFAFRSDPIFWRVDRPARKNSMEKESREGATLKIIRKKGRKWRANNWKERRGEHVKGRGKVKIQKSSLLNSLIQSGQIGFKISRDSR